MMNLHDVLSASGAHARRFLAAAGLCITFAVSGPVEAPAQGLFAGARANYDAFCVGGRTVTVERFEPSGLAHAFCASKPAVILLHGADGLAEAGPLYREAACNLAKAGYATYILHYFDVTPAVAARGGVSPHEIQGRNFVAWQAAVSAAVCWVASQPGIDPQRVGLMGFSLGSYLALSEGARNPQVAAIVEFFGGLPSQVAGMVRHLPPTLIIHGEADRTVPVTEALRLRDVMASRGLYHELVIYPGAGHELNAQTRADAAQRVLRFLRCNL